MSLTSRQISLIQGSFAKVEPIAAQAADIFYNKLFEFDPRLRGLFGSDMKSQGGKLMAVLKAAVSGLNDLGKLVPVLHSLAGRHVKYGVTVDDYTPVGNALLYTLKTGLGKDFNAETEEAWTALYRLVATTMRQHAYADYDPATYRNHRQYNRQGL
ncbi:MAG: hypothetical protein RLZZ200_622 [Pseudomonadota bacterium]